jgi:hypothetical protein
MLRSYDLNAVNVGDPIIISAGNRGFYGPPHVVKVPVTRTTATLVIAEVPTGAGFREYRFTRRTGREHGGDHACAYPVNQETEAWMAETRAEKGAYDRRNKALSIIRGASWNRYSIETLEAVSELVEQENTEQNNV